MSNLYINGYFYFEQSKGGVNRFASEIVSAIDDLLPMKDKNIDVVLLLPDIEELSQPVFKNIRVEKLFYFKNKYIWEQVILSFYVGGNFLINLANFAPILKKNQLCVIHDALIFRYPQSYGKKFVFLTQIFHKIIFRRAKYVATVSEFSKNELVLCLGNGVIRDDILVLGNSAEHILSIHPDNSILNRNNLTKGNYILVVLSQKNSFYKNVSMVINIARSCNVLIVCVGSVENIDCNESNLRVIGRVTDNELKALYANAKFLFVPSFYEGFGIPLLEAMENKCPVVASDIPVFHEICGNAAEYINAYDCDETVLLINALILNNKRLNEMSSLGLQVVCNYRWDTLAKKILEIVL